MENVLEGNKSINLSIFMSRDRQEGEENAYL